MDSGQVKAALVQVLETYRRCGISRFGRTAAEQLSPELIEKLATLNSQIENVPSRLAIPTQPGIRPDPNRSSAPLTQDAAISTVSPSFPPASERVPSQPFPNQPIPSPATPSQPWSLPVLSVEDRQQHFAALGAEVRDCRKCAGIVTFRQQTVFGDGNLTPTLCFMGEAPGADEDRTGKPFVGKAGQLLTKIILAMQLQREEVYILNALKCRPPQNRTPMPDEIDQCRHFVEAQLEILQPKFIVCLGAVAVRSLLRSEQSIGRLRGKFHNYRNARVVVTYHPSYLLRNESAKKLVWEDMKMLMAELPR